VTWLKRKQKGLPRLSDFDHSHSASICTLLYNRCLYRLLPLFELKSYKMCLHQESGFVSTVIYVITGDNNSCMTNAFIFISGEGIYDEIVNQTKFPAWMKSVESYAHIRSGNGLTWLFKMALPSASSRWAADTTVLQGHLLRPNNN
jgi:hypothetical protein